jgi:hypothetical protein
MMSSQHKKLKRRAIAVAERLSLALSNLKLREVLRNQSIRDPLTGCITDATWRSPWRAR